MIWWLLLAFFAGASLPMIGFVALLIWAMNEPAPKQSKDERSLAA